MKLLLKSPRQKETISIGWMWPLSGWVKLNCGGAWKWYGNLTRCGGLLRNSDGRWIEGYFKNIGMCDVLHAEMLGTYLGLEIWFIRIFFSVN